MPEQPRVRVERELCISAGYCAEIAPLTFALDEEGISVVTDASTATGDELREAAETCPAGAIWSDA